MQNLAFIVYGLPLTCVCESIYSSYFSNLIFFFSEAETSPGDESIRFEDVAIFKGMDCVYALIKIFKFFCQIMPPP